MASRSKTIRFALGFFVTGFIFVLIAFVAPAWLVTNGKLADPQFLRLGLWEICLRHFKHPRHWYDTVFNDCWWIFEEEYYIISDILLPGFFVATQFFFTVAFTLCLLAIIIIALFYKVKKNDDKYIMVLLTIGTLIVVAGVCGTISIITFGARGDGRDWMPDWEFNDLGWGFALGVIGTLLLYPAGVLFLVEARVNRYKRLNEIHSREQSAYTLEERKVQYTGGHTAI